MKNMPRIAITSFLALSAVFGTSGCIGMSSEEQDLLAADVGDEDIGEAQEALVYSCTNVSNANWPDNWETLETQVLAEVNKLRASGTTCPNGVRPKVPALTLNTNLRCAARSHSKDMGVNNFFSHYSSDGTYFDTRAAQAGYSWGALAENITTASQATGIVTGWKNSSIHCENMMNPTYVHFAVGHHYNSTSTSKYKTTLVLGKPL